MQSCKSTGNEYFAGFKHGELIHLFTLELKVLRYVVSASNTKLLCNVILCKRVTKIYFT